VRLAVCACLLLSATAGVAADPAAERARIDAERHRVEARYAAEQADCSERFVVTSCADEAKARRRDALAVLRKQELQLDDAERKRRVAARLQELERKKDESAARPAPAPPTTTVVRKPAGAAAAASHAPRAPHDDAAEAQEAARRAQAAEKRRADAAADQAKIAAREAERAARGKAVAPLPVPSEVAASAAAKR